MMKKNKWHPRDGFSLLETLLTTMILAGIMVIILNILNGYAQNIQARATHKYMEQVGEAVISMLSKPVYYNAIYDLALVEPNLILELSFDDLKNGFGVAPNDIPPSNVLNANFREQTPLKTGVSVMVRVADNTANATDIIALEVIVATNQRSADKKIRKISNFMKGAGGLYRTVANGVRNGFNSWQLPIANFAGSTWGDIVNAAPPSVDDGGYIVYYSHIPKPDIFGDYLYRDFTGDSEYNTMYGPLNMGANNIQGVDNIDATGTAEFDNGMIVNGSMTVTGRAQFNNANMIANERVTAPSATIRGTSTTRPSGNLGVDGSLNANTLSVTRNVSADSAIFENGFTTTGDVSSNLVNIGGTTNTTNMNVSSLSSNGITYNVNVAGALVADNTTTTNLTTVGSNGIGIISSQVSGNLSVGGSLLSNDVGFTTLSVGTFGACDKGC